MADANGDRDETTMLVVSRAPSVSQIIARKSLLWARNSLEKLPIRLTLGNLGFLAVVLAVMMPRAFTYILVYPIFRLVFGTLYPAYASYKAVRTKNVKEYVKWMMYWIVFALFTCAETFTDVFFSFWFPFYYEIKIILVLWLLSPATKGSSILYRRFVHPALSRREAEIDEALARATEQGYTAVLHLGTRGVNYATTVLMQTAIKGGGGLVQQLKKSYSLSDLTGEKEDENRNTSSMRDETDMEVEPRRREHPGRRGYSPRRTQSSSNRVEMYFSEVDVDVRQPRSRDPIASLTNIRSSDDISSGYSSGEALQPHRAAAQGDSLLRTSSVGARTRARPRSTTTKKVPEDDGEDDGEDSRISELHTLDKIQFPSSSPLSLISAGQALELLLLLSQLDPNRKEILESTNTKVENAVSETTASDESQRTQREMSADCEINLATIEEIVELPQNVISRENEHVREDKVEITSTDQENIGTQPEEACAKIDTEKITDEICQDKLDELKVLLSNAHKAVTNIVSSHEAVRSSSTNSVNTAEEGSIPTFKSLGNSSLQEETCIVDPCIVDPIGTSSLNSLDVWMTPNVSPSNSESDCRAGKYHKKPAPKVPTSNTEDDPDLDESTSQSALKATLVIKTGTLKTFTNESQTKDVFLSHRPDGVKSAKKKRRREGFSKLLTIPKSIFNNAFHKDRKNDAVKDEDSSSMFSEASTSRSRSVSVSSSHAESLKNFDSVASTKQLHDVQE